MVKIVQLSGRVSFRTPFIIKVVEESSASNRGAIRASVRGAGFWHFMWVNSVITGKEVDSAHDLLFMETIRSLLLNSKLFDNLKMSNSPKRGKRAKA